MIDSQWMTFLTHEFRGDEKGEWFTLGDEHINHMLIAYIIEKDSNFLGKYIGYGNRKILSFNFGQGFDLKIKCNDKTTIIEIKTWSNFSSDQRPEYAEKNLLQYDANNILYVFLTSNPLTSWNFDVIRSKSNGSATLITIKTIVHDLESIDAASPVSAIAIDYARSLRTLAPKLIDEHWQEYEA